MFFWEVKYHFWAVFILERVILGLFFMGRECSFGKLSVISGQFSFWKGLFLGCSLWVVKCSFGKLSVISGQFSFWKGLF